MQIKVWHKCFKDGRVCVESDPCSGRSATSRTPENVETVWAAINKYATSQELEADLGIPTTTVSAILRQGLGLNHVMAQFILQLLLLEQREHCATDANDLTQTAAINESHFLEKVIPGDESWVYTYDPEMTA